MSENRARYPIAVMCRVLGVSPSGYYAWAKRPVSERAVMDAALIVTIRVAHAASKGTYGAPRLQADLADAGIRISRKRIAFGKRCREAGVRPSMGSVGDACDNAMAESFFATLECELLDRCSFKTQAEARLGNPAFRRDQAPRCLS